MRIAVISDTHGNASALVRGVECIGSVDVILHLGDHGSDLAPFMGSWPETYAVRGNMDSRGNLPEELLLSFEGHTLLICHGHRYGVKQGLQRLFYRGLDLGADIVLFGHTHKALNMREENLLMLNPGSAAKPHPGERPSVAVLELGPDLCEAKIITL